jgi:hypothetical protein
MNASPFAIWLDALIAPSSDSEHALFTAGPEPLLPLVPVVPLALVVPFDPLAPAVPFELVVPFVSVEAPPVEPVEGVTCPPHAAHTEKIKNRVLLITPPSPFLGRAARLRHEKSGIEAAAVGCRGVGFAFARAWLTVSGRAFTRALVAPTAAWALPAAVIFGGHGLRASDALHILASSSLAWCAFVVGFAALTMPVVNAVLDAPGVTMLASSRSKHTVRLANASALLIAQAPIFILFQQAGRPFAGLLHAALTLALELSFRIVSRALPRVSPRASRIPLPRAARAFTQLCAYYMRTLARRHASALLLASASLAAGAAALWLSCRNDPPKSFVTRAFSVLPIPLCASAAAILAPLLRAELSLRSLFATTRARPWLSAMAVATIVMVPHAAYASVATVAASSPSNGLAAAAPTALFGAIVSGAIVAWGRRHARTRRRDPAVYVVGVVVIAFAFVLVGALS